MHSHLSSLISTPELQSVTDSSLSKDSVTINGLPYTPYPMTTSSATNTTGQENPGSNAKQTQLYKTEYCRNWAELGECRYGKKCRYAHGISELRQVARHSRYKTQICRTYHTLGTCLYGNRCTFIHEYQDLAKIMNGENKQVMGSSSSLLDDDHGDWEADDGVDTLGKDKLTIATGNLRQHSRFFATKNDSKDHQVPSLQPSPPLLPTTTKPIKFLNKGVWHSKLGFGIPQPPAHTTNVVHQQGLAPNPTLTTTPTPTAMADNKQTTLEHQTHEPSHRFCAPPRSHSLPSYSASMNRYSHATGTYTTISCYQQQKQHDLNTCATLDTADANPLASLALGGGYPGSYSSYLSSSSSFKSPSFFII